MMAKKTFSRRLEDLGNIDNPAADFINIDDTESTSQTTKELKNAVVEGEKDKRPNIEYKKRPKVEPRSKRHPLMIQPSLYEKIADIARLEDVSVNEIIHNILETVFLSE